MTEPRGPSRDEGERRPLVGFNSLSTSTTQSQRLTLSQPGTRVVAAIRCRSRSRFRRVGRRDQSHDRTAANSISSSP